MEKQEIYKTIGEYKKFLEEKGYQVIYMEGIYTTSVNEGTIDESPFAYKPMEEILEHIKDTVEVHRIIKPIYNFKAGE